MCNYDSPTGERFSLVYMRSESESRDSTRMRFRLARVYERMLNRGGNSVALGNLLEDELGISVVDASDYGGSVFVSWESFLGSANISDVLDSMTLCWRLINEKLTSSLADAFIRDAQRIFSETQLGYSIDERGGIHPAIDPAFEANRISTIRAISGEEFNAVRAFIDSAEAALLADPLDGRHAIRATYDAVENLFKQMFSGETHITNAGIRDRLRPHVQAHYVNDSGTLRSALKQTDGLKSWVEGAHFYRHPAGGSDPNQPPDHLTILMVSQGFSFVRWLASLGSV